MFVTYIRTKFLTPTQSYTVVTAVKLKAKEKVLMAAILFYVARNKSLEKLHTFQ
jgi:hypothetical protein